MNLTDLQQADPAKYQRFMEFENLMALRIDGVGSIPDSIIIPVVVHVVYYNSTQNISNAQINSQIQVLNEDFKRLNADSTNTPTAFRSVAGRANVIFKLAAIDPNDNATSGITRTSTTVNGFVQETNNVKFTATGGHDAWDPYYYLNIWVCNLHNHFGYAQFPADLASSPNTDGVVISYRCFGEGGSSVFPYNKGRTATHEVGHWLNLRHIWGDEDNCTATDFVSDTPNQYTATYEYPSFPKTDYCTTTSPGIMFMNYMDYTDDGCMNIFTKGQVDRMLAIFDTQTGIRKGMLIYADYLTGGSCVNNFVDQIITTDTTVTSDCSIYMQDVTVTNGAKLTLDAAGRVNIISGFEVELGSELEIKK
jgi:hypothetical protein